MIFESRDAIIEFFNHIVSLDLVLLINESQPRQKLFTNLQYLTRLISMQKQQQSFSQFFLIIKINIFIQNSIKIGSEIITGFQPISEYGIDILTIVFAFGKTVSLFEVDDCPIEIDLVEHDLFFLIIIIKFFFLQLKYYIFFGLFFRMRFIFYLLLINNNSIRIIFKSLLVPPQHHLSIRLTKIMLDHMIITILQSLTDILQTRFVLIQFIMNRRYQVVNQTILFIRNQTMTKQLFG